MNINFQEIAPYLKDPLILIGFFLLLAISFFRIIIKNKIIPQMSTVLGYRILRMILLIIFILGLLLMLLGFALKYKEIEAQKLTFRDRELAQLTSDLKTILDNYRVPEQGQNLILQKALDSYRAGIPRERILEQIQFTIDSDRANNVSHPKANYPNRQRPSLATDRPSQKTDTSDANQSPIRSIPEPPAKSPETSFSTPQRFVPTEERKSLLSYDDPYEAPYRSVAKLFVTFADGTELQGTGVFVGANRVLTAAHNVYKDTHAGKARKVTVIPAYDDRKRNGPFGTTESSQLFVAEEYIEEKDQNYDFAVILTAVGLGSKCGWLGYETPSFEDLGQITIVGYDEGGNRILGRASAISMSNGKIKYVASSSYKGSDAFFLNRRSIVIGINAGLGEGIPLNVKLLNSLVKR